MSAQRIELGFSDVLDLMTKMFEIPAVDGRAALTSRLKHLQAKRFPAGVNVKRARARYDGTALTGILVVLALVASFVPPDVAVAITRENWDTLRPMIADAARLAPSLGGTPDPGAAKTFAVIDANALAALGTADAAEGRAAGARGRRRLRALSRTELAGVTPATLSGATTILDLAALTERMAGKLIAEHGQDAATVLADLASLGEVGEPAAASADGRAKRRTGGAGG